MLNILIAILMFFLVIVVHEAGHFALAKLLNVSVEEFSIGMGPLLLDKKSNETQYSWRLLPIGGYVSLEEVDENDPNSFKNAPVYKRLLIILAGAFMNVVSAIVLFFIIALIVGSPTNSIGEITEGSIASTSELQVGDEILSINGVETKSWEDVSEAIASSNKLNFIVNRSGSKEEVYVDKNGEETLGIIAGYEKSFFGAIKYSFTIFAVIFSALINFLSSLFSGGFDVNSVSGPVGIVRQIGVAADIGIVYLLYFLAYINVNVAFFNLLPIPALDGFKALLILIEKITGKKLSEKAEGLINLIGFSLLIIILILVTFKDLNV